MGKEGVFTPLLKAFLEEALKGELEAHLVETEAPNRKNGKTKKRLRTSLGELELESPRDRAGAFTPKIVAKRQKHL